MTLEKSEAMKTLDFNEPMVYDDMNNLMMEHVAVFKVL